MPRKKKDPSEKKEKPKASVKSLFIEVTPDKYFVLCNGQTVKNYTELAAILEDIGDDIYSYHVTSDRNDFANWIHDVFDEKELAESIRKAKNKHELIALLYKHLYHKLEKMLK